MKYQVVYFTRSGNSKRIAEHIASQVNVTPIQISDGKSWKGFFGYMKAGYYSTAKRKVSITLSSEIGEYDELIVVTPLWAGGIAPATKTFLQNHPKNQIHLVVSSIGSTTKDRDGFVSVTDIMSRDQREDEILKQLLSQLK